MFVKGDKIKCINPWSALVLGDVYTATDPAGHSGEYYVTIAEINGGDNSFAQHRFVKVNTFKGNK
jgi:hypothetical protein